MTPITRRELDSFYSFVAARIGNEEATETLESCVELWRHEGEENRAYGRVFADGRTLYDRLKDSGTLGASNDGPTDLATNPIHMEGFGES